MKVLQTIIMAFTMLTAVTDIAFSQTITSNQTTDSTKVATLKVKGISCSMDLKLLISNVEKLEGVSSCKAVKQGPTTTFEVKYNPALVAEKDFIKAIENSGSCDNPDARPYKIK